MVNWIKKSTTGTAVIVNKVFDETVKKSGLVLNSDATKKIKETTIAAMATAGSIAKNISDLNKDGKVDAEDLKIAAEKAGVVWSSIDPDLKTAMLTGGVAGLGINSVPVFGNMAAVPTFVGTTAYFFVKLKLKKLEK